MNQSKEDLELYRSIGRIEGVLEKMDEKIDRYMKETTERLCGCEGIVTSHSNIISNTQGKLTVWGIIGGFIASIGIYVVNWIITHNIL
jgi:hypothetical protein